MGWNPFRAVKNAVVGTVSAVGEAAAYTASAVTEVADVALNNTVGHFVDHEFNTAEEIDSLMGELGVETEFERRAHNIAGIAGAVVSTADQRVDEDGNALFFTEEGELTTEDTGIIAPAQKTDHNDQLLYLDENGEETTEVTDNPAYQSDGFVNSTVLPWAGNASQYVVGMGNEVTDVVLNNTVGLVVDHEFNTSAEMDKFFREQWDIETSFEERGETGWEETGNYAEFWYDDPGRASALLGQGLLDSATSTVGLAGDVVYGAGRVVVAGVANSGLAEGEEGMSYVVRDEDGNANFFRMSNGFKDWAQIAEAADQFMTFPVDDPDHFIFDANSDTFNPDSEYYEPDLASLYELNSETNRYQLRAGVDPSITGMLAGSSIKNPNYKYESATVAAGQAVGEVGAFIAVSIPTGGAGGAALAAARGTAATAKNVLTTGRLIGATTTTVRTSASVGGAIRAGQATNRVSKAIRAASSGLDEAADTARIADRALDAAKATDEGVDAAQAIATTSREAVETATSGLDDALNGARRLDRELGSRQFLVAGQRGVQQADLEQHLARYAEKLAQRTAKVDDLLEQGVTGSRLERARNAVDSATTTLRRELSEVNAVAQRAGLNRIDFEDAAKLTLQRAEMGLGARIVNGAGVGMHRTGNFIIPNSRLEWALEGTIAAGTAGFLTSQKLEEGAAEMEQYDDFRGGMEGSADAGLSDTFGQQTATNGSVSAAGADTEGAGETSLEFGNRSSGLVTPTEGPVFTITVSPDAAQELERALER